MAAKFWMGVSGRRRSIQFAGVGLRCTGRVTMSNAESLCQVVVFRPVGKITRNRWQSAVLLTVVTQSTRRLPAVTVNVVSMGRITDSRVRDASFLLPLPLTVRASPAGMRRDKATFTVARMGPCSVTDTETRPRDRAFRLEMIRSFSG